MRRWPAQAALAIATVAIAACGSEPLEAHAPIFAQAPWTGPERLSYELRQRGDLQGWCVLETQPEAAPGVTELRRLCTDAQEGRYQDNGFVQVEPATLRPFSALRVNGDLREGGEQRFATTYLPAEGLVRFESRRYDADESGLTEPEPSKTLSVDRALPEPAEGVPEPGWYDDEELLWLVRGIPLEEGYAGAYTNVNAATGRVFSAEVRVEQREQVEVPAGVFEAWKVRIETSTVTNFAWVALAPPHRVVKARIERFTYELAMVE